jgi:ribonuclease BN (tRNA processing enzyme)
MKIELIPTTVTPWTSLKGQYLTSFLIDDTTAIDAGGIGLISDVARQSRVRDVFLTHCHLDHIASLPFFLDNVFSSSPDGINLYAGRDTLDALASHLFNGLIWPDFLNLKRGGEAYVRQIELVPGRPVEVGDLTLTPIGVDHVVPTLGFLIEKDGVAVGIPSDTGPTEEFWARATEVENLRAVLLEASFPDRMADLANRSKHLTPSMFLSEARKLGRAARFIAVHIKPGTFEETSRELRQLSLPGKSFEIGETGKVYEF